ncbi:ribose 5-phosphate isomerase B [Paenibacillus phoenicis]|jgi:ribose 5-phosphate isomerase B|uniref:Ribose 5-phosphate isomerase B n=1 Tax=Paenibacillus phoenicis TaxID=554117 RepID=A0ABU5PQ43_9BACL|nr:MULTISPECIES: ribose 5-phosphate isomerase B [Paenibacillus]EES73138.1 ribose-5-phosphate isomerase B [Paenibacillus sp. oral taxon 786 str. D14]MCT2196135.1 ribose 5-phosphate isomerase B [Paenibacillus sp. p3-SID1389]MEA3572018.1 ribose 5-phosphate isomerase B [Paenibacillus phoenicis]
MKVVIANDHGGLMLKRELASLLREMNAEVVDLGCDTQDAVDYPDYAIRAAAMVANGEAERGILICGTGIGMSIAANKVPGIRCALAHDVFSAKATRLHNDSNMLALGERVIGPGLAREIVKTWIETEFEGGRHQRRIDKVSNYERSARSE